MSERVIFADSFGLDASAEGSAFGAGKQPRTGEFAWNPVPVEKSDLSHASGFETEEQNRDGVGSVRPER